MDPTALPAQNPPPSMTPPVAQSTPEKPEEWQMIVTILTLFFFTPLGIIFMWLWMKNWPKWLKIIITLVPIVFFILWLFAFTAIFVAVFIRNLPKSTPSPNYLLSTPIPASNSATATSSAALAKYDSPCMSFNAPAGFTKTLENSANDGSTNVSFAKQVNTQKLAINVACNSAAPNSSLKSDTDAIANTPVFKQGGSISDLKIGNLEAKKIMINDIGTEAVIGYYKKYHLFLNASSQDLKLNDPQNDISKAVDTIVNSFIPKDIFNK